MTSSYLSALHLSLCPEKEIRQHQGCIYVWRSPPTFPVIQTNSLALCIKNTASLKHQTLPDFLSRVLFEGHRTLDRPCTVITPPDRQSCHCIRTSIGLSPGYGNNHKQNYCPQKAQLIALHHLAPKARSRAKCLHTPVREIHPPEMKKY